MKARATRVTIMSKLDVLVRPACSRGGEPVLAAFAHMRAQLARSAHCPARAPSVAASKLNTINLSPILPFWSSLCAAASDSAPGCRPTFERNEAEREYGAAASQPQRPLLQRVFARRPTWRAI